MLEHKKGNNFLILLSAIACFGIATFFHQKSKKPPIVVDKQSSAVNVNWTFLKILSAGNKRLISDVLWIQTLLESDLEHYRKKDLNSWMYLRFRTIAELEPQFYENYLYGGMFLSIIKDDLEGAADIYERGIKMYPNDYRLHYNAGFNYYFEMGRFEEGLNLLEKIVDHPDASQGLPLIINKIRFETGAGYEVALDFIKKQLELTKDPVLEKKLAGDYYALKAQRDLECLNEGRTNCDYLDAEGNSYRKIGSSWEAKKKFIPYRIHLKQKK